MSPWVIYDQFGELGVSCFTKNGTLPCQDLSGFQHSVQGHALLKLLPTFPPRTACSTLWTCYAQDALAQQVW